MRFSAVGLSTSALCKSSRRGLLNVCAEKFLKWCGRKFSSAPFLSLWLVCVACYGAFRGLDFFGIRCKKGGIIFSKYGRRNKSKRHFPRMWQRRNNKARRGHSKVCRQLRQNFQALGGKVLPEKIEESVIGGVSGIGAKKGAVCVMSRSFFVSGLS